MSRNRGGGRTAMITITCGHSGCGRTQRLRRKKLIPCDGYMCRRDHGAVNDPPPGLVREIVVQAAGGFDGWRDVVPDEELLAAMARARRLALYGLAQTIPVEEVEAVIRVLVAPAGAATRGILVVDEMSTGVEVAADGSLIVELPNVAAVFCAMLRQKATRAGVVLRTFTGSPAATAAEVRGWFMSAGRLHPLAAADIRSAHCTDSSSGRSMPPEPGVTFHDAWPVDLPA